MTRRTVPAAETGRRNQSPAILRLNPGQLGPRRDTAICVPTSRPARSRPMLLPGSSTASPCVSGTLYRMNRIPVIHL